MCLATCWKHIFWGDSSMLAPVLTISALELRLQHALLCLRWMSLPCVCSFQPACGRQCLALAHALKQLLECLTGGRPALGPSVLLLGRHIAVGRVSLLHGSLGGRILPGQLISRPAGMQLDWDYTILQPCCCLHNCAHLARPANAWPVNRHMLSMKLAGLTGCHCRGQ